MTDPRPADSALQLTAALDRALIHTKGESVRFLAVEVAAPTVEASGAPKAPLNLALVIDASGSMAGADIEAARQGARLLAERLNESDTLSVVSFDNDVTVHVDGRRQDAAGRAAAAKAIAAIEAGSSTNLGGGWLEGCRAVAQVMERTPGLRNHVVVLSDGMANAGITEPHELARHAEELRSRGVLSSAVGIGASYSDLQLEAIAANGGGRLHHASEAPEICELVLGELDELRATVVESCDLRLDAPAGVRVEVVGDYAVTRRARGIECVVGSLASGARRTVVFKLTCPSGRTGERLEVATSARWRRAGESATEETAARTVELRFATSRECAQQPRDADLVLRVAQAWQLAVVRTATRLNQEGALDRAARFVDEELRHFEHYCRGLAAAGPLVHALRRLHASVGQHRYERMAAKEMLNASVKGTRGERELRKGKSIVWEEHLPK